MFDESFIAPLAFSLAAAAITTTGLVAAAWRGSWVLQQSKLFAAFAAGAIIGAALLHLLPEAVHSSPRAPVLLLTGFVSAFVVNRGIHGVAHAHGRPELAVGLTPMLAIALHSFIDGVVYTVTFSVSFAAGAVTTLGLILHEFPEGVITFALLRAGGLSARTAFVLAFLAAAVTTPLGAIVAEPFVALLGPDALGDSFAVAAGVLLYVGAGHLLPHVEHEPARLSLPALGLGVMSALGLVLFGIGHETGGLAAAH